MLPSELLTDALRSLAPQVALGHMPPTVDPRELLQRIVRHVDGAPEERSGAADDDDCRRYSAAYLEKFVADFPPHKRIV